MYVRFGNNKVRFETPKDLKNKREIGVYKIRDGYATVAYTKKDSKESYTGSIKVRLPVVAKDYEDKAFGIGGR